MTRRHKIICIALTGLTAALFWPIPEPRLHRLYPLRFFSKEKILLREFRNPAGAYGSSLPLSEYPKPLIRAVIAAEDARFIGHCGIDFVAMARAALDNLRQSRIRSGASTITQQLARTIYAEALPQNRILKKIGEIAIAFKITLTVPKSQTLEAYLNQVAMPLNSTGLAAAAERIFGKHVTLLSDEETVGLAVMIRSGSFARFEAKFLSLWAKLYPGKTPDLAHLHSALEKIAPPRTASLTGSEHFISWLSENRLPTYGEIRSEISANMNQRIAEIIRNEMRAIYEAGADHAAVVVIEKTGGDDILRAMVGSADFFSEAGGEINHAVRIRSAGSTLKPFVYGLGFDQKLFAASTVFFDGETALATGREHETYRPQNNDMRFWGQMTLREALVSSRNIPALAAAEKAGIDNLLVLLRRGGLTHLTHNADHYGPGLALGSGGITLLQLARLYSAIASAGMLHPLRIGEDGTGRALRIGARDRLLSEETAARLTHMLTDRALRRRAFGKRNFLDFPFPVAAKTGTSKDYRDGWVAGFTPRFTIAVWVGNSQGIPMRSVSGAWGAGRIFHQVMRLVNAGAHQQFAAHSRMQEIRVCRKSGLKASESCPSHAELSAPGEKTAGFCQLRHGSAELQDETLPRLISPSPGERYVLHPNESAARQEIPIIIHGTGKTAFAYALDNETPRTAQGEVRDFRRLAGGDYILRVFAGGEVLEEINFSVR